MKQEAANDKKTKTPLKAAKKQQGSNLVTIAGIVILAVILLIAAYFKVSSLIVLTIILLLISIIAYLWSAFALSHLEFSFSSAHTEGFPGQEMSVRASLTNKKLLPVIWLSLSMPEKKVRAVSAKTEGGNLRSFLWVMPYQTLSWDLKLKAKKRGYWRAENLRVAGGDGFGLAQQEKNLDIKNPVTFIVYPELVPADTSFLRSRAQELETVLHGTHEDTTLLKLVRDYQYGDNARNINWRQVAKSTQLIVNVYETQDMRHIALAFDTESYVKTVVIEEDNIKKSVRRLNEKAFEAAASLLASVAADLLEHGVCTTLYLEDRRICASAPAQAGEIFCALAMLDPEEEKLDLPGESAFSFRHQDGPMFLFTNKTDARIQTWLNTWRDLSACVICTGKKTLSDPAVIEEGKVRG